MTYSLNVRAFTDFISDRALEQLCRKNPELKFETDATGKLLIMSRRAEWLRSPSDDWQSAVPIGTDRPGGLGAKRRLCAEAKAESVTAIY